MICHSFDYCTYTFDGHPQMHRDTDDHHRGTVDAVNALSIVNEDDVLEIFAMNHPFGRNNDFANHNSNHRDALNANYRRYSNHCYRSWSW